MLIRAQQGVTLTELLVVIAVLAILMGVVYPNGERMLENHRQAAELNQLLATLERARQEAVISGARVELCQGVACGDLTAQNARADWTLVSHRFDPPATVFRRQDGQQFAIEASVDRLIFDPPPGVQTQDRLVLVNTGFNRINPQVVLIRSTGRAAIVDCSYVSTDGVVNAAALPSCP